MPTIRNPMKMRTKIMLSSIGCMLLALLLQTALFYRSSSQILYRQTQQINRNTMENLQDDLYALNKAIENSLNKVYNQTDFLRELAEEQPAEQLRRGHGLLAYDLALSEFIPAQNVTALYLYTVEHELISSYRHAQTPTYQYPENIYEGATAFDSGQIVDYVLSDERVMLLTSYFNPHREVTLVRYVLKIYRGGVTPIGYLVCDVDPKPFLPFLKLLEKYRYSDTQTVRIQPMGGEVAVVAGDSKGDDAFLSVAESIGGGTFPVDSTRYAGYELFSAGEHKYIFDAYSLTPQTLLRLNQRALLNNTLVVMALIVLVFAALFLLVSRGLTRPLTDVVDTMQRIKTGETRLRLRPMQQDEIGILGQEFNEMLDEIERLLTREYETKRLLDDAKYKALQAQVNPHFLYNTLDTMSGIANNQNCTAVATLCRALSNIFRYSLDMEQPFATLEQEILHIKNYLYVMNVRMNNALQIQINIPAELRVLLFPRLSIQPLVENAVQHGLREKRGDKQLVIGAVLAQDMVEIWVEDNGVGGRPAAVPRIWKSAGRLGRQYAAGLEIPGRFIQTDDSMAGGGDGTGGVAGLCGRKPRGERWLFMTGGNAAGTGINQ